MSDPRCPASEILREARGRPTVCPPCGKVLAACQNCGAPYVAPPGSPPVPIEFCGDCAPASRYGGAAAILLDPRLGESVSASIVDSVGVGLPTFVRAKGDSHVDIERAHVRDVGTVVDLSGNATANIDGLIDDYTLHQDEDWTDES